MGWLTSRCSASSDEAMVAEAILMSSGDPRAAVFVEQLRKEGCVSRKVEGSRLRVKVEWTTDDLDVELDRPVTSRPVRVTDQASGRGLTFVVEVGRGIFRTLTGESEGPWPRRWSVDPEELARAAVGAMSLDVGPPGVRIDGLQLEACRRAGAVPEPVVQGSKLGIAKNVRSGLLPINGLRHPPEGDTNGWYIWAGEELPSDPDFFEALHVEHVAEWCPIAVPYLALPPGWRFLTDGSSHEDMWRDDDLLEV